MEGFISYKRPSFAEQQAHRKQIEEITKAGFGPIIHRKRMGARRAGLPKKVEPRRAAFSDEWRRVNRCFFIYFLDSRSPTPQERLPLLPVTKRGAGTYGFPIGSIVGRGLSGLTLDHARIERPLNQECITTAVDAAHKRTRTAMGLYFACENIFKSKPGGKENSELARILTYATGLILDEDNHVETIIRRLAKRIRQTTHRIKRFLRGDPSKPIRSLTKTLRLGRLGHFNIGADEFSRRPSKGGPGDMAVLIAA